MTPIGYMLYVNNTQIGCLGKPHFRPVETGVVRIYRCKQNSAPLHNFFVTFFTTFSPKLWPFKPLFGWWATFFRQTKVCQVLF